MRLFVLSVLAILLVATGCKRECLCCGQGYFTVTCTKDTTSFTLTAYTASAATDSFNYYTAKGFTCVDSTKLFNNAAAHQVCGSLAVKDEETGGFTCIDNAHISNCR